MGYSLNLVHSQQRKGSSTLEPSRRELGNTVQVGQGGGYLQLELSNLNCQRMTSKALLTMKEE
jgi:hypothetical protein